jgi:hypothetical protein
MNTFNMLDKEVSGFISYTVYTKHGADVIARGSCTVTSKTIEDFRDGIIKEIKERDPQLELSILYVHLDCFIPL